MPDAKKAKSNFLIFCEEKRVELKAKHPEMKSTQIVQECSKQWKELSESEKDVYTKKYQELKAALPVVAKPEKPKSDKPKSAYINFCTLSRGKVKAANPGLGPKDLMKKIAEEWTKLSVDEKAKYKTEAIAETKIPEAKSVQVIEVKVVEEVKEEPQTEVKVVEKKTRVRKAKKAEPALVDN